MKKQSIFTNLNNMNKNLLKEVLRKGDTVVDATLGNGNDALFLAKLIGPKGKLIAFDIQKRAIETSIEKMEKNGLSNYFFINDGHEKIDEFVSEASAVVFNLGYLPGSSREIITKSETTLTAIMKSLTLLKKSGVMSIVFYTGHPGGIAEKEIVLSYVRSLDRKEFDVLEIKHLNSKETAPFLLIIYKKGE